MKIILSVFLVLCCISVCMCAEHTLALQPQKQGWESTLSFRLTADTQGKRTDSTLTYKSSALPDGSIIKARTEGPFGSTANSPVIRETALPFEITPQGIKLLPSDGRLFIGNNMSNAAVIPQLSLPDRPVLSITEQLQQLEEIRREHLQEDTAPCRWKGSVINPFSGNTIETANTLISVADNLASISTSYAQPSSEGRIMSDRLMDSEKKRLGTRFSMVYNDYEGTADVSYTGYFVFDTEAGRTVRAAEQYYITGILKPKGVPITIEDAKDKFLYMTIYINIVHKSTVKQEK